VNNVQQQVREAVDVLVESGPGYLFTQVRGREILRSWLRIFYLVAVAVTLGRR
jgi:hypothetical protein